MFHELHVARGREIFPNRKRSMQAILKRMAALFQAISWIGVRIYARRRSSSHPSPQKPSANLLDPRSRKTSEIDVFQNLPLRRVVESDIIGISFGRI